MTTGYPMPCMGYAPRGAGRDDLVGRPFPVVSESVDTTDEQILQTNTPNWPSDDAIPILVDFFSLTKTYMHECPFSAVN
jgi:hypothetical protein